MDKAKGESRRDFLKLATTTAPVAAVAAVVAPKDAAAAEAGDAGEGLRETAHTKAYLDSARF
ncbi:MAG: ubiquinol-cytochrome c reductase iron-sulfur subunit N-terminal domain-containing protein [Pseudomonadota bacterium]